MSDEPKEIAHEHRAHAALGASNSSIWLNCPGSYALSIGQERKSSVYAREGSAAHELAELHLMQHLRGIVPQSPAEIVIEGDKIEVQDEMIQGVGLYVTTCAHLIEQAIWHGVEVRVSLAELWAPAQPPFNMFGTADCIALDDNGKLTVCDLKYGKGKMVSPEDNSQLLYYGLGAFLALPPELRGTVREVELIIVQPRAGKEKIKSWSIKLIDLMIWANDPLKRTVDKIANGDTTLKAGTHCYFCVAAPVCPELHQAKIRKAIESFPDLPDEEAA